MNEYSNHRVFETYSLQLIRENRFQKLYDGTNRKQTSMSHWAIDALMELMNKNVKELDFPNTIDGWQLHSQNLMFALSSRSFVMNEYSNHRVLEVQDAKNSGVNNYEELSQKGNVKVSSTPTNRTNEKILCSEVLNLAHTFSDIPKRKFDNSIYWDTLGKITTKLDKKCKDVNEQSEVNMLSNFTSSLINRSIESNKNNTSGHL